MTLGCWEAPLVDTSVSQNYLLSLCTSFFQILPYISGYISSQAASNFIKCVPEDLHK